MELQNVLTRIYLLVMMNDIKSADTLLLQNMSFYSYKKAINLLIVSFVNDGGLSILYLAREHVIKYIRGVDGVPTIIPV